MEKEIKKWLKSKRNYTEGVELFQKYGKNPRLKSFFLINDNDFSHEKLAYELGKIISIDTSPLVAKVEENNGDEANAATDSNEGKKSIETGDDGKTEDLKAPIDPRLVNQDYPEDLAQMILERGHLVNKKGKLSNSLDTIAADDNAGRKAVMDEMSEIRERINQINEAERFWQKNKQMPKLQDTPGKPDILSGPLPTDPIELLKLRKSLTEMRSKAKKKLENVGENSEDGQNLAIKISKINERYEAVEKAQS